MQTTNTALAAGKGETKGGIVGRVEGKVAFVSGAGRGQGRSHALRLAEEGADIIATDYCGPLNEWVLPAASADDLAETVRQVEALGRRVVSYPVDVRDLGAVKSATNQGVAELGGLDIVVANAGVADAAPVPAVEMHPEAWQIMLDVNLTGVWNTCKACIPHLQSGASIIVTASGVAIRPYGNISGYLAAKTGVNGLMRALAMELSPEGIRVNSVNPGFVNTTMIQNDSTYKIFMPDVAGPTKEEFARICEEMNLMPTPWLEPVDVSNAILFLASDEARFLTGMSMVLDAGLTLN
jgi:SDR family mycofactocin-dependent oxidoreductase